MSRQRSASSSPRRRPGHYANHQDAAAIDAKWKGEEPESNVIPIKRQAS